MHISHFASTQLIDRLQRATRSRYIRIHESGFDEDGMPCVTAVIYVPMYSFPAWYIWRRPRAEAALLDSLPVPMRGRIFTRWTWF